VATPPRAPAASRANISQPIVTGHRAPPKEIWIKSACSAEPTIPDTRSSPGCGTRISCRNAHSKRAAAPVPPVLSGRDQVPARTFSKKIPLVQFYPSPPMQFQRSPDPPLAPTVLAIILPCDLGNNMVRSTRVAAAGVYTCPSPVSAYDIHAISATASMECGSSWVIFENPPPRWGREGWG
jgi:hypothetical protein